MPTGIFNRYDLSIFGVLKREINAKTKKHNEKEIYFPFQIER